MPLKAGPRAPGVTLTHPGVVLLQRNNGAVHNGLDAAMQHGQLALQYFTWALQCSNNVGPAAETIGAPTDNQSGQPEIEMAATMYTLAYLAPIRAGRNKGSHELMMVTTPRYEVAFDLYLSLDRRHVRNVRIWKNGRTNVPHG